MNVAARLQAASTPGTVIVGERTHRLTRAAIEYVELEPLTVKGKAEPVPAWEAVRAVVRGPRGARQPDRGAAGGPRGRGRPAALAVRADQRESQPHLVTILGQAGVGKSRLLRELSQQLGERERRAGSAARRLSPVRSRPRLLGAGGDRARHLRHRRHRRRRHRLGQARGGIAALTSDLDLEEPRRLAVALGRPLGHRAAVADGDAADDEDPQQMRDGSSRPSAR